MVPGVRGRGMVTGVGGWGYGLRGRYSPRGGIVPGGCGPKGV